MKRLSFLIAAALLAPALPVLAQETPDKADLAHLRMGQGNSKAALQLMTEHVSEHPQDGAARLDLVRYLTWNGAYAKAERVLLADPAVAQSPEGKAVHAFLLAGAGRVRSARALNEPLLAANADDLQANFSQAMALAQTTQPYLGLPFVEAVKRLKPGTKDSVDLERSSWVRRASFVSLGYTRRTSSDDLSSHLPTLTGEYALRDGLRLTAELGRWTYHAPESSPFASIGGGETVGETRGLLGLRYAPTEYSELQFAVGSSSLDGDGTAIWRARAYMRFSDSVAGTLLLDRDRVAASPRSLSLGLTRHGGEVQVHVTPDMNWTGDLSYRRDNYSDDNRSNDLTLALRRSALRSPKFIMDLGVVAQHLHYDFSPGNGYYAPDNYRRYGATMHGYVGLGPETGIALHAVLGRQRDETFTSWRPANDLDATLIVGALSPWEFRATAAYTQRAQNTGAYEGYSFALQIIRRF